jgi:glycosyltransferase involved in cell wall biosynthesis
MLRVTFFMEQGKGYRTYYRNLRPFVDMNPDIAPTWVPITYHRPNSLLDRWPILPAGIRGVLHARRQVLEGFQKGPCDVAFFNPYVPAVLGGALTFRQPYVIRSDITPRQFDSMAYAYNHPVDRFGPLRAYKHRAATRVFRNAAHFVCLTTWVRNSYVNDYGVPPERLDVLPVGVDLELWRPDPARASVADDTDAEDAVQDTFLRAFRALPPGTAELHLAAWPPAPEGEGIFLHTKMKPNSSELIALYQSADVFVLPSEADTFGIVAVEASAAGVPAIVTDVGGVASVVADGVTGFVIEPGDVATLVERLRLLAADPALRWRMGRAARQRAEARFDMRKITARTIEIILEAAQAAPARS